MSFEIVRSESATVVNMVGGHRFDMPAITDGDLTTEPIQLFQSAGLLVGEAFDKLKVIGADRALSALGIEQKAEPVKAEAVGRVAAAAGQVRLFENGIINMENQLYAVPSMDQGHTVAAIEDREIRDWWRSLGVKEHATILDQVKADPAQHERLMIALMRAPAPLALLDHQTKFVSEVWKDAKRASNPETAARIEIDRQLVETSRRGLSHLASITSRALEWKAEKTLRALLTSPFETAQYGYDIFGFTGAQVATMRRRMETEPKH